MAKFRCIESHTDYVRVGMEVEGILLPGNKQFRLIKEYKEQLWKKDSIMPINGSVWRWSSVLESKYSCW